VKGYLASLYAAFVYYGAIATGVVGSVPVAALAVVLGGLAGPVLFAVMHRSTVGWYESVGYAATVSFPMAISAGALFFDVSNIDWSFFFYFFLTYCCVAPVVLAALPFRFSAWLCGRAL
jgi:hypothetical protein